MKKQRLNISKLGFLLSVMGSAVGLGGIWGFPTQMYNHHGAFLIPFLICMVICAIPVLFIEMTIGNKYRKNHIEFFSEVGGKKGAFFSWLHSTTVILLSTYYSVLVGWTLINIIISFTSNLNKGSYFYHNILQQTNDQDISNLNSLGNLNWMILLATIGVWIILGIILLGGVEKGIEKANKIMIPFLFLMIIILAIYTSTLSGAKLGLNVMFDLDAKELLNPRLWKDAFGQSFFMLSTCTGTIYIYAAHAPKKQDSTNQAFVVAFGTSVIGILTTIIVFNSIGAIAQNQGKTDIKDVFQAGPALIFQVIPQLFTIINNQVPILGNILAILFFVTLFFAGMSSLIGQVESMVNGLEYEIHLKRKQALAISLLGAMAVSVLFTFSNSPALFNGLAIWVAQIWLLIIGFILLIGISPYGWKLYDTLKLYNNENSWMKWTKGYKIVILIIAPILILINIATGIYDFIINIINANFVYGTVGLTLGVGLVLLLTFILTYHKNIHNGFNKLFKIKTKTERG
ncbi:sodium-dependent transporter [Spiroplasma endosymbiont of Dasysyrphus albostriatus]|uniref:sodium-dependent transporter n=1 Tax=Spiroplasma endosymbiont of Dasysyrphus albostriatus TaxID=3066299 RepID=UPI0030D2323F